MVNTLCKLQSATEILVLTRVLLIWLETNEAYKVLEADRMGDLHQRCCRVPSFPLLFLFWLYLELTREGTRQWGQQSRQARGPGCPQCRQKAGRPQQQGQAGKG